MRHAGNVTKILYTLRNLRWFPSHVDIRDPGDIGLAAFTDTVLSLYRRLVLHETAYHNGLILKVLGLLACVGDVTFTDAGRSCAVSCKYCIHRYDY